MMERLSGGCMIAEGDCLEIGRPLVMVQVIMGAGQLHVMTDPPYEAIMHEAKGSAAKRGLRIDGGAEPKPLDFEGIDQIRGAVIDLASSCCTGWTLLFCSPEGVRPWADLINASRLKYKRACVWIKPDSAPQLNGQGPAMGAENFVAAWGGAGHARWNAGGKRGVWTFPVNPRDRDGRHPTEKPWRLMASLIEDFTAPGDIIFDPFMGSGSTGVAALRLGRRFIGIEKAPHYYAVARDRLRHCLDQPDLLMEPARKLEQGRMDLGIPE